jgi:hypothetical protein
LPSFTIAMPSVTHRCRRDLRFDQMSGQQLSASNFPATVDATARVFIQSGVVTVLEKGPTSAGIGDTAPSIVVLHGDSAVCASEDKARGLKAVKGNGEYLATLASETKTPVGGKSAAGEACHKEENCGKPEYANALDDCVRALGFECRLAP